MPGDFLSKAHLTDQLFPEKIRTRTVLGTLWVLSEDVFQTTTCGTAFFSAASHLPEGGSDTQVAELAKRKQLCFLPLHWTFFGLLLSLPFVQ